MDLFSRSKSLNNIPMRKLQEILLSVVNECEICSKKESKDNLSDGLCQKCALKNVIFNRFYEANIPIEYWNLKMEKDFVGDQRLLNLYNEITADISKIYTTGTSYILAGSYGLGKTFALSSIIKKAAVCGYNVLYTTLSDVVNILTSNNEDRSIARRELIMADFLVIDEFDQRYIGSDNASDLYGRTLEGIFRTRAQNKLPLFMSTNSPNPLEMFNGSLKESLGSLMKGYLKVFVVLGDDFRKNNK